MDGGARESCACRTVLLTFVSVFRAEHNNTHLCKEIMLGIITTMRRLVHSSVNAESLGMVSASELDTIVLLVDATKPIACVPCAT